MADEMTEHEELMIYGNVMHILKPDGAMERVDREKWDIFYDPEQRK